MTANMRYTLVVAAVLCATRAQLLPGGVPLYNAGYVGMPMNTYYQNMNGDSETVGMPFIPQLFPKGLPLIRPLARPLSLPGLSLGRSPGLRTIPLKPLGLRVSPLQLRSTDAKENTDSQKAVQSANPEDGKVIEKSIPVPEIDKKVESLIEEIKRESKIPMEQTKIPNAEKPADSMDPVDQETDDIPKEVIGASGSLPDDSTSSVPQPKIRSPGNGESIPDLDFLSRVANPIDDLEKKVEKTAKKIGKGIKHTFRELFKGRAKESESEEQTVPYKSWMKNADDDNSENKGPTIGEKMDEYSKVLESSRQNSPYSRQQNLAPGLKAAMDQFQKSLSKSELMQKSYDNQRTGNAYENKYDFDAYSQGKQASPAEKLWNSAGNVAKSVAETWMNGGQPKSEQNFGKAATEPTQQNNPMTKLWESATKAADKFADTLKIPNGPGMTVPNSQQNPTPDNFWQTMSDLVDGYVKVPTNVEQLDSSQYLGSPYREQYGYGYGYGGYPHGNYGNGHQHQHHGHGGPYNPYYPPHYGNYNPYYPRPNWQHGGGYYKRSPKDAENSTVTRNSRGLPIIFDGTSDSTADVAESVFDLVRSIIDGRPDQIAHASVNMGSEIADAASDSDIYKRSNLKEGENSTLARNLRQMPWPQLAQPGGMTNSAMMLAQSILAGRPDQIANAGVNMGSRIAGTANGGQRFSKRSDSLETKNSTSSRNPRQMLPLIPGFLPPVQTGLASTALNFAQGFVGGDPNNNQGVIQPIVGGVATSAHNMAQRIGLIQANPNLERLPAGQVGQIVGSAVNLAQGIATNSPDQIANAGVRMGTGIVGAANQVATQQPFKRSDSVVAQNATSTRILRQMPPWSQGWAQPGIATSALNLAQGILSGRPDQIANSGVNMGTGIVGAANQANVQVPRFFKRSDSAVAQNATSTRILRQMPPWFQRWPQPGITNEALNLAQGILSGRPDQIANSGVNMGTGIAGTAGGPRFFKRSPQGGLWRSATGLAGSIADSATVDPSNLGTEEVMGTAGTIWKAAHNLFGDLGKFAITPVNSDQIVGATKDGNGGNVLPADLIWESISDLAGNIAKVTEKPSILGKALTSVNKPDKSVIKSPNQVANSDVLGAMKPSTGEIANSATNLASRIASLLMIPSLFGNPNLDSSDFQPTNPILNPIHMAGDIVGASLNPGAYRNVRMLNSYAPISTENYVQRSVPVLSASPEQPRTVLVY